MGPENLDYLEVAGGTGDLFEEDPSVNAGGKFLGEEAPRNRDQASPVCVGLNSLDWGKVAGTSEHVGCDPGPQAS